MKKEYFYYLLITLAFVIMATFNACKPEPEPEPEPQTPGSVSVTTSSVSDITETSAKCGGTVTASGYSVGNCGLCYSELPNPTINSYITSDQMGTGTFTSTMSGLEPGTKYYVRAYATTSSGTLYGEQKEFTTLGDENNNELLPVVITDTITDITKTSSTCWGIVTSDGNDSIISRGFCWSTNLNPSVDGNHTSDSVGIGTFKSTIIGLASNTTYYVRAYATNNNGTSYGEHRSFTTMQDENLPVVITSDVNDITKTSATCGGNVTDDGGSEVGVKGVCWSTTSNPTIDKDAHTSDGSGIGNYTSSITGLTSNTTYYVRAYATNSAGTSYGEQKNFTTDSENTIPIVNTSEASDVTKNTAVCGGEVVDDGGSEVTSRGVCWNTSPYPTIDCNYTVDGHGEGVFVSNLDNLEHSTTYYVRAYAINSIGVIYGEEISFKTLPEIPSVVTYPLSSITQTTVSCGGNVTDGGGTVVISRGVCWSTEQNPTIENSHTTDGSGLGDFTSSITGLTLKTTYYIRAYATNSEGTGYGEERSFTTLPELPTVITYPVTDFTGNSATFGGNVISDGGEEIIRGFCWSTSENPTINDNHTENGNGIGDFYANITELEPITEYYVRAYATNSAGTSYGEQMSFTTLYAPINGHDWIDLGLPSGLKWATCNVGANNPEDYGNYYAWGETETKSTYTIANSITNGVEMEDISGNPEYDAASANWGSRWRMPTEEEYRELQYECTWQWTTQNGVYGQKVTGPNGNYIFLPAAGYRCESSLLEAGERGHYWTSTTNNDETYEYDDDAESLIITNVAWVLGREYRYKGYTIRPVSE